MGKENGTRKVFEYLPFFFACSFRTECMDLGLDGRNDITN